MGAAVAPVATRRGSRFIASFGIVDSAQRLMDCLGGIGLVGTCRASRITPPLQIDSIRSNWKIESFGTSFSIRSDRLAIYFPRPDLQKPSWCLLRDSFFDRSYENSSRFMKKSRFESIRFIIRSSLIPALNTCP